MVKLLNNFIKTEFFVEQADIFSQLEFNQKEIENISFLLSPKIISIEQNDT